MSAGAGRLRVLAALVLAGALVMLTTTGAHALTLTISMRNLDLVASAQATTSSPDDSDSAYAEVWAAGMVRADAVATSSTGCDDCSAAAGALQIVHAASTMVVRADNVAVDWSSCTACGGRVISVQIVLVHGSPRLVLNNHAFAANAACDSCVTTAQAYQVVVSTPTAAMATALIAQVKSWMSDQMGGGGDPGVTPQSRTATSDAAGAGTLDDLTSLVTRATGGTVISKSVQVD